jgi:two-component system response regulator LytT
MKMVIIEDEPLASERLQLLLKQYDSTAQLSASLESVEESVQWFAGNPSPDLVFADIQLSDGSVFDFFGRVKKNVPVIFTTAYDKYALEAFKLLSVGYLLKPVTLDALTAAINKLKLLQTQPQPPVFNYNELIKLIQQKPENYKSRFTGKCGDKLFFVETKSIAMFRADNKIVSIIPSDNNRYIADHTLEQLEQMLDPDCWFRINRSMIVNITAISQVKPYEKNRLQVILKNNSKSIAAIISRERVADFRKWAEN